MSRLIVIPRREAFIVAGALWLSLSINFAILFDQLEKRQQRRRMRPRAKRAEAMRGELLTIMEIHAALFSENELSPEEVARIKHKVQIQSLQDERYLEVLKAIDQKYS